jgi:hypothetical protein
MFMCYFGGGIGHLVLGMCHDMTDDGNEMDVDLTPEEDRAHGHHDTDTPSLPPQDASPTAEDSDREESWDEADVNSESESDGYSSDDGDYSEEGSDDDFGPEDGENIWDDDDDGYGSL